MGADRSVSQSVNAYKGWWVRGRAIWGGVLRVSDYLPLISLFSVLSCGCLVAYIQHADKLSLQ